MDDTSATEAYRVLARKYRPRTFAELIGQDVMVQTVTNAITADRLPHAFILTGVRGVGKTSTARIIARSLNCVRDDGKGGPTIEPCGNCEHCVSISEDRHVDVIEMDAASRTGVNDIRELIEGVRYRPVSARYKIYIIDEVHMLSTSAFNALLKTLEEPPEHVKFIFATTETRKVPVTVLSRCQRFDLRRVDTERLISHFSNIANQESVEVDEGALGLIARAADGSVRDGLSLLDQAIAHAGGLVSEVIVRDMLGLADGGRIYDLYAAAMKGEVTEALGVFTEIYESGTDPSIILQDLLQLTHWLTRVKLNPLTAEQPGVSQLDRERGSTLSTTLDMPSLGRTWQLLLKGLDEVRLAPSGAQAAEMVLIRLAYITNLPSPAEVIKTLKGGAGGGPSDGSSGQEQTNDSGELAQSANHKSSTSTDLFAAVNVFKNEAGSAASAPIRETNALPNNSVSEPTLSIDTYEDVVKLFGEKREALLYAALSGQVHLVRFEPRHISIRVTEDAPSDLANRVSHMLTEWTGEQWLVSLSAEEGEPTLRAKKEEVEVERRGQAVGHPLVQAAMVAFPGATVEAIYDLNAQSPQPPSYPDLLDDVEENME